MLLLEEDKAFIELIIIMKEYKNSAIGVRNIGIGQNL
jgi:hypothetical protein